VDAGAVPSDLTMGSVAGNIVAESGYHRIVR